jgi:hypothetical protein
MDPNNLPTHNCRCSFGIANRQFIQLKPYIALGNRREGATPVFNKRGVVVTINSENVD